MRVRGLPLVPELGDRQRLAERDEDRVVAEAFVTTRLVGDVTLERSGRAGLRPVRRKCDELADVASTAIRGSGELREQLLDRVVRPAR